MDTKEFRKRLFAGQMTRRELHKVLLSAGVVTVTAPLMGRGAKAAEEQPMYFGWAGYEDPGLWQAYEEKHGELPRFTFWGDEEEGVTKLLAGFRPDLVFPCNYKIQKWWATGLLQPIDTSKLSHWDEVIDSLKALDVGMAGDERIWVPVDWGLTSVLYRTDLVPEYADNETYGILWDPKYKGRIAVFDSLVDGVAIAAIMAGVDPFKYTDETIEKTREWTKRLQENILYWSNDVTTLEQGLASGELVAATTWNESFARLKAEGLPVKYMNPKEGAMTWVCGLAIVKDTPYYDKVHEMIDAMLDPRSRAWEIENFGYGVSTQAGFDLVDEATLAELGLSRNPEEYLANGIYQESIEPEDKLQAMFDEVKAGL